MHDWAVGLKGSDMNSDISQQKVQDINVSSTLKGRLKGKTRGKGSKHLRLQALYSL